MSINTSTPTVTEKPWKNEFDRRIKAFSNAVKLDLDKVIEILREGLGIDGESEDCLTMLDSEEYVTSSDIFKHFVDSGVSKIARVRMGLAHLRGKTELEPPKETLNGNHSVAEAITKLVDQNRPIESWTIEELLNRYDESHPEVAERLSKITHGRPCVVLNTDGSVNIEASVPLIKASVKQPTSDRHVVNGRIVRVYRAGTEFPVKPLDESPFFRGVALVNGFCAKSATDWNNIPHEVRVMVRIYIYEIETTKLSKKAMQDICKDAKLSTCITNADGLVTGRSRWPNCEDFREKYPEAAMRYDELNELNELPSLKISHKNAKEQTYSGARDSGF